MMLLEGRNRDGEAIALECGGDRVTYLQLQSDVEALAVAFQAADPTPNSRVGICAFNTREHLTALLATYAAGKTWVPLSPRLGKRELDAMIAATGPTIIVADEDCRDRFTANGAWLVTGWTESKSAVGDTVQGLIEKHIGARARPDLREPEDVQVIKWSGGSTGIPKGVLQSIRCINAQAKTIRHHFEFTSRDVNLVVAPLTHGSSCFILPILGAGGRLVLLKHPTVPLMLDAFERGVTTAYLPPTMIYNLLAGPGVGDRSFSALRHLIYSAAPMPPERIAEARRVFGPVLETAYGQVEAPQVVTVMRAEEFADERNLASVGRATISTQVAIMDPEGRHLPPGEIGEIAVRGDLVMNGYLGQPELTSRTLVDGWLRTGDLGTLDDRGYLFLKGRTRELINTGGFKVYPAEVESTLARHPAVAECCVFGEADAKWGEAVHVAVQLRAGITATEAELIAFVKRELDSVKAPKAVHFVEALPRNAAGKVARGAVREMVHAARR